MQQAYTLKALITNTICADMSLRERSNHHRYEKGATIIATRKGQTSSPKKGRFYGRQWADPGHRATKRASSPKKCTFLRRRCFVVLSGHTLISRIDTLRIDTLMFEIK